MTTRKIPTLASKLRIGTHEPVSFEALDKMVGDLIEKANVSAEHVSLGGPPLGSHFVLQFTGRPDVAARRAKQTNGALRRDNGQWEQLSVNNPAGSPTRVFIEPDKCPRQRDQENIGRGLSKACKALLPGLSDHAVALRKWNKKKETTVVINFKPIVIIECTSKDAEPAFWWDEANLESVGLSKASVLEKYEEAKESFRAARAARWSR